MRGRHLLAVLCGAAAWPIDTRAGPSVRKRRIAVLMGGLVEDDAGGQEEVAALRKGIERLGWAPHRDVEIDFLWPGMDLDRVRALARDVAAKSPDLVLSRSTPATAALMREGSTLPIVFIGVTEPVGSGFVQSLARPGGNMTGFTNFDASIGGKWVELLRELSPSLARIALLFNPKTAPFAEAFLRSVEAVANNVGVAVLPTAVGDDDEIERAITTLAREPGCGIIGITDAFITERRKLIIALAARHRLPAVYANRVFTRNGGLMAYAVDFPDLFLRAASYVDRIFKGALPADLPVQHPQKFELSLNLKTAGALGLEVPPALLARVDKVIE
jgi:putative tryptophan/tyrosine transport system substrate-binding protein